MISLSIAELSSMCVQTEITLEGMILDYIMFSSVDAVEVLRVQL